MNDDRADRVLARLGYHRPSDGAMYRRAVVLAVNERPDITDIDDLTARAFVHLDTLAHADARARFLGAREAMSLASRTPGRAVVTVIETPGAPKWGVAFIDADGRGVVATYPTPDAAQAACDRLDVTDPTDPVRALVDEWLAKPSPKSSLTTEPSSTVTPVPGSRA